MKAKTTFTNGHSHIAKNDHQLRLYGMPYRNSAGQWISPILEKNTLRPAFEYHYHEGFASLTPMSPCDHPNQTIDGSMEWLLRERRGVDFADVTGLKRIEYSEEFEAFFRRAGDVARLDHLSWWVSENGTLFLLTEPYNGWDKNSWATRSVGLQHIRIPDNLAPWSGRWTPESDAQPLGRAYLICDISAALELTEIASQAHAAAPSLPRWNDTAGVRQ